MEERDLAEIQFELTVTESVQACPYFEQYRQSVIWRLLDYFSL